MEEVCRANLEANLEATAILLRFAKGVSARDPLWDWHEY